MRLKPFLCPDCGKAFAKAVAIVDHRRDAHGITGTVAPITPAVNPADPLCIECGKVAELVGGDRIYPHRPDLYGKRFWLCACGAYCGCHSATTRPLGFPCGPETRRARMAAHEVFDPLWRSRSMDRRAAYSWLADRMGIEPEACHIGMMTAAQAWQVVELCRQRRSASA